MGQDNIIELNGKRYDAITGALLGEGRVRTTLAGQTPQRHRGRVIDGFVRGSKAGQPAPVVVKPATAHTAARPHPAAAPIVGKKMDVQRVHKNAKTVKPHQPERSKTLMRHVVSKPKATMKPAIKTTAPTEMMARPASTLAKPLEKKVSVTQVNPVRLARARHVAKSQHIRRFSHHRTEAEQHVPVRAASQAAHRSVGQAAHTAPAPAKAVSHSAALAKAEQQLTAKQHNIDIFEAALARAVSHEQPAHPIKRRRGSRKRLVNALAGVGAFLVIGGFLTYLNMPKIELQFASMRAGFHAAMPDYQPNGYALDGGIQSRKGQITMQFRSGDSAYQITQQTSDWNSATLLDQKTEEQGAPVETIQSQGRIIYLYDNNATWVNGGVRYEISGNAALDADELVSVATSM